MKKILFAALAVSLFGCNTAPTHNQNWPELSRRNLPGVWTSDKAGRLIISCEGYIHLDDQGNFDLGNTSLKNAKIVELRDQELLIETFPLVKDHFPMALYPYQEHGKWKMGFWDRTWSKVEERDCGGAE